VSSFYVRSRALSRKITLLGINPTITFDLRNVNFMLWYYWNTAKDEWEVE
jgi:hypothetical protein